MNRANLTTDNKRANVVEIFYSVYLSTTTCYSRTKKIDITYFQILVGIGQGSNNNLLHTERELYQLSFHNGERLAT